MSSIYEALERARKEGGRTTALPPPGRPVPVSFPDAADRTPPGRFSTAMASLHGALRRVVNTRGDGIVVHFVSATPGEGTSTIAREFAHLAATAGHRRVLLADGNGSNYSTARTYDCPTETGLVDTVRDGTPYDHALRKVGGGALTVGCLVGANGSLSLDGAGVRNAYALLRGAFDLVVVDCPSVGTGTYWDLVPEATDGIILVVQAEKARPPVVQHAKGELEMAGGNIVGAVLNKRKDYIPSFIYRML